MLDLKSKRTSVQSTGNHFAHERRQMIEFLRSRNITDERVLRVMQDLPREIFLDSHFAVRSYEDSALPIGSGQTISQPYTVAYMTQALRLKPQEKVLEIGTGSGYQASVLFALGCKVFTIERHMPLLQEAKKRFDLLGYNNILSRGGDGSRGWDEYAPYDAIIVTAGAPDVPETLVKQLNPNGGRLIIPVGSLDKQKMYLIVSSEGKLTVTELPEFMFVPLIGKEGWSQDDRK